MKLVRQIVIASLMIIAGSFAGVRGQSKAVTPRVIDHANFDNFRRMWGTPDGAFYLMERGGCQIRTYPGGKSHSVRLRGSRKLVSSARGNYYGVIRYNSFSPSALSIREITLYNRNGKKQYTINKPGCTIFVISDKGPYVVGISGPEGMGETHLKFYDAHGKLVGNPVVRDFSNPGFSADGNYFYAQSSEGLLIRFSNNGERQQEYDRCRKYFLSDNGKNVATFTDSILTIFGESDSPLGLSVTGPDLRDVRFSNDGSRLAMLSSDRLEVFDLAERKLIGEYHRTDSTYQLLHMAANDDLSAIVCSATNSDASPEIRHRAGKILLFDGSATKLWENDLSYSDWTVRYPEVRMNRDGSLFSALTPDGLKVYQF